MELLFALCLAIGLGACAGLRSFVPLFLLGLAMRMQFPLMGITDGMAGYWLATDLALFIFGALAVVECMVDMVPVADLAMDVPYFVISPLAGGILAFSSLEGMPGGFYLALIVGILVACLVTIPVHTTSTTVRVVSTATTGGVANPVVSIKETVLSVVGVIGFLILAPLMLIGAGMFAYAVFRWVKNRRRQSADLVPVQQ